MIDTIKPKSEHLEQAMFVSWFRKNYMPTHRIFAIPNGGLRSKSQGMALKTEGVTKGVPDLMIPSLKVFIEMKKEKGGKVSVEQIDWLKYLANNGYIVKVCNGCEEAKEFILTIVNK